MSEQRMFFRLGLCLLLSAGLLAGMFYLFGTFPLLFPRANRQFTAVFTDAPGVSPGTPVRRSGVRVGEVQRLDLDSESGEVRVVLSLERNYVLRRHEKPTLVQGVLAGDVSIDLVPTAAEDRSPVPAGEVLTGMCQSNVSALLSQASEVVPTTQETLQEVRRALQRFEKMAPLLEEAIREYRDLAHSTREVVPELRRTNQEIKTAMQTWGRVGDRFDEVVKGNQDRVVQALDNFNTSVQRIGQVFNDDNRQNLSVLLTNARKGSEALDEVTQTTSAMLKESRQTVLKINTAVARADEALGNLQETTKPFADRTDKIMKNLDESSEKLNKILTEVGELVRMAGRDQGTLGRLLADPSLYNNLDKAACLVTKLLLRVDQVLADVEVFADKIARHPESLGIGGAVRPGVGIK